MNLQPLFSVSEIGKAIKILKRKSFRKSFDELRRFSSKEERGLSSFGAYLRKISAVGYYEELSNFSFLPYWGVKITKKSGKFRPLLIPSPKDRVALAASFPKVKKQLAGELKKYRALGLGLASEENAECRKVLIKIQKTIESEGMYYVLKLDFQDFFSSIDRKILLTHLRKFFKGYEQRTLFRFIKASVENSIDAPVEFWELFEKLNLKTIGVPQGLAYSPLLASFYALPLDKITQRIDGCKSYRYLDDMIVLAKSEEKAQYAYRLIKKASEDLKLTLHPLGEKSKTTLVNINQRTFEFLGVGISKERLFIPRDAIDSFQNIFKAEILNDNIAKKFSFEEIFKVYKPFARGWANYYKSNCPENYKEVKIELEQYLGDYIKKSRLRKRLFEPFRLTLDFPFADIVR